MNITCCDVPSYLPTFPQTWRKELSSLICKVLDEKTIVDCQAVKDCETVTSVSNLSFSNNVLSFTYFDERGEGNYRSIDLSSGLTGIYTFTNGLTSLSNVIKWGGILNEETTINVSTYRLNFTGEDIRFPTYLSGRTPDTYNGTYLFTNNVGKLMVGDLEADVLDIVGDYEVPLTFNNGLTRDINDLVQLGGDLEVPTIIGNTNSDEELVDNYLWIKNRTAFGIEEPDEKYILRSSNYGRITDDINPFYSFKAILTPESIGVRTSPYANYGTRSSLLNYTNIYGIDGDILTGSFGNIIIVGTDSVPDTTVEGRLSSFTAANFLSGQQIAKTIEEPSPTVLPNAGTIEKLIGLRVITPLQIESTGEVEVGLYEGTINDTYGILIESQRGVDNIDTAQTNTWGVYQEGVNDFNKFYGITGFGPFGLSNLSAQVNVSRAAKHNYKSTGLNSYIQLNENRGITPIDSNITTSIQGIVDLSFPANETFTSSAFVSAVDAKVIYSSNTSNVTGKVASIITNSLFYSGISSNGGGSFDKLIGVRVTRPLQLEPTILLDAKDYTGTIADTYGILIEQQSGGLRVGATQTRTWGIYQEGATDVNYFNGRIRLTNTSCPIYADNTAADAGSQSGEIYRLTGDRTIYMKP